MVMIVTWLSHDRHTVPHPSPTSDGSAAAVVCSEQFVRQHGLENQAVEVVAMEMRTDFPSTFDEKSCTKMVCLWVWRTVMLTVIGGFPPVGGL